MTIALDDTIAKVGFVHLHVHTSFSLREGALPLGKLLKLAQADEQPALAVTDSNNLFGALEFSEKSVKEGLQPITGAQLAVDFADGESMRVPGEPPRHDASLGNLVLLAMDEVGYLNLMKLVSAAWTGVDPSDAAHVTLAQLREAHDGLIALSGGPSGPLDRAFACGHDAVAELRLDALVEIFPRRLYVELQRHGLDSEKEVEPALIAAAYRRELPVVATNEPYFAGKSDYDAHDALLCIAEGALVSQDNRRRLTPEHRFKTRAEMLALFADLPEATRNSVEIALRCAYRPKTRAPILPNFTEGTDEAAELRAQAVAGLKARLDAHGPAPGQTVEDYDKRLEFELGIIERMKFPGYFLIVSDFIKWSKSQGIPVGPGRGSGAGSLVAYALTITDLDPMRFSLLFERFLNPERVSMPDFDIDFCQTRRDEVIAYVRRRYGAGSRRPDHHLRLFFSTRRSPERGACAGNAAGPGRQARQDDPAKPGGADDAATGPGQRATPQGQSERDSKVAKLLEIAQKLEGLYSNASTHAAGIVIGDRPLDQLVPLYQDPKSEMPATQFNMKWVEPAGLVKFDFLGLKTLTTLSTCLERLKKRGIVVDLAHIPLDDAKTFEMLGRGETVGVFQLESAGMRKALTEMRADRFEDIIALVALYRPGPMANIPTYCAVKLGEEDAEYLHPKIEPVLKETFGVIIYQEQVMQIAQILSGYSLGEADMLRRAMGKKIKAEMDHQRARFVEGALREGVTQAKADEIFDYLAKFADYGFNKSHAAAYALVAYQTAWCKANYPVEFMAASMTLDKANTDKLSEFRNEARRMGIRIEPPSINLSGVDFEVHPTPEGELTIRYALSAVKGVGEGQAAALVATRGAENFKSLAHLAQRLNPREVNKKVLESLAAAGAFDELERDRAKAFASMEKILALANVAQDDARAGQNALFGGGEPEPLRLGKWDNWSAEERLKREFDSIGFFLSGHPLDAYAAVLQKLRVRNWTTFARAVKQGASADRLAATVLDRNERRTKSGNKMGIVTLSDPSGQYEAILFQEGLTQYRDLLEKGACVLVTLQGNIEGEDVRARITLVEKLDEAAARIQKGLRISLRDGAALPALSEKLKGRPEGEVTLLLRLEEGEREVEIKLPGKYPINAAVSNAIKSMQGVAEVELV